MVVMTQEGEMIQVCAAVLAPNEIDITIPVEFVFQPDTATGEKADYFDGACIYRGGGRRGGQAYDSSIVRAYSY